MEQANSKTIKALDYAPIPDNAKASRLRRWVVVVCVVVCSVPLGAIGLDRYRKIVIAHHLAAAEQACLKYSAPPETVVYDPKLPPVIPAARASLVQFYFYGMDLPISRGTAFMHELRRPDGEPRLVIIDVVQSPGGSPSSRAGSLSLAVHCFLTISLNSRLGEVTNPAVDVHRFDVASDSARLFAGQLDHNSRSHFTIQFSSPGTEGLIDGYLHNDDSVTLEVRRPESVEH